MSRETDIEIRQAWATRDELDAMVAELEKRLPAVLAVVEDHVADAFAGEAEVIEERAGPEDCDYIHDRLMELADLARVFRPPPDEDGSGGPHLGS